MTPPLWDAAALPPSARACAPQPHTPGSFERDRFHGDGSYFYKNGDVYSGSWARGIKHGSGTFLCHADASDRTGTWFKGALIAGKWLWADGTVWLGTFRDSLPLGLGVYYFPNGTMQEGEYVAAVTSAPENGDAAIAAVWKALPYVAANIPAAEVARAPLVGA